MRSCSSMIPHADERLPELGGSIVPWALPVPARSAPRSRDRVAGAPSGGAAWLGRSWGARPLLAARRSGREARLPPLTSDDPYGRDAHFSPRCPDPSGRSRTRASRSTPSESEGRRARRVWGAPRYQRSSIRRFAIVRSWWTASTTDAVFSLPPRREVDIYSVSASIHGFVRGSPSVRPAALDKARTIRLRAHLGGHGELARGATVHANHDGGHGNMNSSADSLYGCE